ncbi:ISSfl3 orfC,D [Shigella flexneri 2a]|nr:ISSfl3 orfC,D [Shigella flexneri 2a]SRH11843.1 ISSfl3 orfC,D [Shigella flexneri 2a]
MSRKTQRYSKEFKAEAVRTVLENQLSISEGASRLSLPEGTLGQWVTAARKGLGTPGSRTLAELESEILQLRKALNEARLERDILKKATAYFADRKGEHPQLHLAKYQGVLQADAYAGYNVLYETGRVKEAGCLAHARRKIHDEDVRRPTEMTQEALRRIAELYDIEAEIRGSPAEERLAVRKARSVQLMQSLYDWIQLQRKTLSKHAEMAKAFDYILNHWNALNEFCRDGRVEIDNNIGENALRSVAVGRKNYLFFGSDKGGESAAIIYSLLVTCKQNEVEPEDWLREVIEKLNDWPSNQVHELLPWNFSSVK